MRIEKAGEMGFCSGVMRAIKILEKTASSRGAVETLGAVVHNEEVLQRLARIGIRVAESLDDVQGNVLAISSHGVSPELEAEIRARHIDVIDTTCPFVHRAQVTARRLAEAGFFVIVYGNAEHPEVRGVLGWAGGKGVATVDAKTIAGLGGLPHKLGVLSQTTQIPVHFTRFVKELIDFTFDMDSELWVIDTICHDIRKRQAAAISLAGKVDLMFVVGGRNSANTNRLAELCSSVTETHLIETAEEIEPSWLQGRNHIGITGGASTAEQTISEVLAKLKAMT